MDITTMVVCIVGFSTGFYLIRALGTRVMVHRERMAAIRAYTLTSSVNDPATSEILKGVFHDPPVDKPLKKV